MPSPRSAFLVPVLAALGAPAFGQGFRVSRPMTPAPGTSGADVIEFLVSPSADEVFYLADLVGAPAAPRWWRVPLAGGASLPIAIGGDAIFTPDGTRYVYTTSQCFDSCWTYLLSETTDGSASATLDYAVALFGPPFVLPRISPDGMRVVYRLDDALYRVPIDGTAPPYRLSLSTHAVQSDFRTSSDGVWAVYRTHQLWAAPLLIDSAPRQLNGAGTVLDFRITPDGSRVVYLSDQERPGRYELFVRPIDRSTPAVKVSGTLVAGGDVQIGLELAPDGQWVAYRADATVDERFELLRAPLDASAPPVVLSGALVANGDVRGDFALGAGGARVVYRTDAVVDERIELWSAPADGSGAPVRLCPLPVTGGDVTSFALSDDGAWVVLRGDLVRDERFEIWSARSDGTGTPVALAGTIPDSADVEADFRIGPGGSGAYFRLDRDADDAFQLFRRALTGAGGLVECNGPLVAGGSVQPGFAVPRGLSVVYRADEDVDEAIELWHADLGAATRVRLNAALDPGPITGDVVDFAATPGAERVVYRADADADEVFELYSAALDAPGGIVKLHPPLSGSRDVGAYALTLDGEHTLFTADLDGSVAGSELHVVPTDGSAAPWKLSGTASAWGPQLAPDGRRAVYFGSAAGATRIHVVPVDGSAPPLSLTGTLPAGQSFAWIRIAADGARVAYGVSIAPSGVVRVVELWSVPLDGSLPPVRLTPPLVAGGQIWTEELAPDGTRVVYLADQEADDVFELFSAPLDGSAPAVKLSGPMVPGGDVPLTGFQSPEGCAVAISADSTRVAYRADQDVDGVEELFVVPIDGSAGPVKRVAGAVGDLLISRDSARVVYLAAPAGPTELFSIPLDGSGPAVKLNGPLVPGGNVGELNELAFAITADSARVVYEADQEVDGRTELYSAPIDGSAAPAKLNPPGTFVTNSQLGRDGRWAVFRGAQAILGAPYELFAAPADGSRAARLVSGPMVAGGDVRPGELSGTGFAISSDSRRVVYLADQDVDEVHELFGGILGKPLWRR